MATLQVCHLGPLGYREGLEVQEALVEARAAGETGDWVLFPDHPPVLTVGRNPSAGALRASPEVLRERGIEVFEVRRGGDITWHGPGQLVGYPIFDLTPRNHDLHKFLRSIEQVLIDALASYGIGAARSAGRTGVWVGAEKVASIGIAVRRWVSYHGFALNVNPDLADFELIHPCGLDGVRMTSMALLRGESAPGFEDVRERVVRGIAAEFGYSDVVQVPASRAWDIVGDQGRADRREVRPRNATTGESKT